MTQLICVLDVDTREEAQAIVAAAGACPWFKVGSQLFTRCGPEAVRDLTVAGKQVMLDLKYHDIPNTVAKAAAGAAALGAGMFTIHALGARKMIAEARAAVDGSVSKILAVTILTSHDDAAVRNEIGLPESAADAVPRLAMMAIDAGAHGIVCSPQEIHAVRTAVGPEPLIVTPGVRPAWAPKDDQQRVMTPHEAAVAGANFVVVGRPILKHPDPAEAVRLIEEELKG